MYNYVIKRLREEIEEIESCILYTKEDIAEPRYSFRTIAESKEKLKKLEAELKEKQKELKKLTGE